MHLNIVKYDASMNTKSIIANYEITYMYYIILDKK